jgi:hypothetical protein
MGSNVGVVWNIQQLLVEPWDIKQGGRKRINIWSIRTGRIPLFLQGVSKKCS